MQASKNRLQSYRILPTQPKAYAAQSVPFRPKIVVVNLNREDDNRTNERNTIGDHKWPIVDNDTLKRKQKRAKTHHDESWQRYTTSLTSANGNDSLWQIAKNKADTGTPADDTC